MPDLSVPLGPSVIHPRWQTSQPGSLPSFARSRGSAARPSAYRKTRTARTIATEILIADAARQRLRTLAKRATSRAPLASATVVHGTIRYDALPYGHQPSTLFDISVPWDERVIASYAFTVEIAGDLPPHLRIRHSSIRFTRFSYTTSGQIVRIIDPYQRQPTCPRDSLDYLCGIALRDNTSLALQDFAIARYAQRHLTGRAEFYITDWVPPP